VSRIWAFRLGHVALAGPQEGRRAAREAVGERERGTERDLLHDNYVYNPLEFRCECTCFFVANTLVFSDANMHMVLC